MRPHVGVGEGERRERRDAGELDGHVRQSGEVEQLAHASEWRVVPVGAEGRLRQSKVVHDELQAGIPSERRKDLGQQPGRVLGWIFFAEGLGAAAGPAIVGVVIELNGVRAGVAAVGVMRLLLTAVAGAAWRLIRL